MSEREPRPAEVGPWAKEKLAALERYLDYYTKRLKNQRWKTIYLDAFAGGGRAVLRQRRRHDDGQVGLWDDGSAPELVEFVAGSPQRALNLANAFDSYIFIDADPMRVQMLRDLKADRRYDRRQITVREGTADDEIAWTLSFRPTPDKYRGVAFLDPFGAHLSWASIVALAQTRVFEVVINFPLHMCLLRLMTRNPEIRDGWREQLDANLPPGWYEQVYETVHGLMGDDVMKRLDASDRLLAWYREQLRKTFGFVSVPRLIKNTRGGPLYYLLWAGPREAGLRGADYILGMADPELGL